MDKVLCKRSRRIVQLAIFMFMSVFLLHGESVQAATKPETPKNIKIQNTKVTWDKVKGADGYQIRYCDVPDLTKSYVPYKTLKKNSCSISYLKNKGTSYYVQVRAYKLTDSNKKVYSKWCRRRPRFNTKYQNIVKKEAKRFGVSEDEYMRVADIAEPGPEGVDILVYMTSDPEIKFTWKEVCQEADNVAKGIVEYMMYQ